MLVALRFVHLDRLLVVFVEHFQVELEDVAVVRVAFSDLLQRDDRKLEVGFGLLSERDLLSEDFPFFVEHRVSCEEVVALFAGTVVEAEVHIVVNGFGLGHISVRKGRFEEDQVLLVFEKDAWIEPGGRLLLDWD